MHHLMISYLLLHKSLCNIKTRHLILILFNMQNQLRISELCILIIALELLSETIKIKAGKIANKIY